MIVAPEQMLTEYAPERFGIDTESYSLFPGLNLECDFSTGFHDMFDEPQILSTGDLPYEHAMTPGHTTGQVFQQYNEVEVPLKNEIDSTVQPAEVEVKEEDALLVIYGYTGEDVRQNEEVVPFENAIKVEDPMVDINTEKRSKKSKKEPKQSKPKKERKSRNSKLDSDSVYVSPSNVETPIAKAVINNTLISTTKTENEPTAHNVPQLSMTKRSRKSIPDYKINLESDTESEQDPPKRARKTKLQKENEDEYAPRLATSRKPKKKEYDALPTSKPSENKENVESSPTAKAQEAVMKIKARPRVPCTECSSTFASEVYLRQHYKSKHTYRPHKCQQCGKSFPTVENLEEHQAIHASKDKPFKCKHCDKQFQHRADFNRHRNSTHTGEVYYCMICDKGFARKDHLDDHYINHVRETTREGRQNKPLNIMRAKEIKN